LTNYLVNSFSNNDIKVFITRILISYLSCYLSSVLLLLRQTHGALSCINNL
jgi:hypothetical protein